MRASLGRSQVVVLGVAMVSSCAVLAPADVEVRREVLAELPRNVPAGTTHAATLLVLPPEASAVYDTTRMAYERRSYQIEYFSRTEWGERPSRMIHSLLVQTLQAAHDFASVVTPPFAGHYSYVLRSEILEFHQNFTAEPVTFELSLRVQLIAAARNQVIGTKAITVREPMREKTPHAGAVAANDATAKALQEVADFVRAEMG